ncbi:hypothetical protein ACQR0U_25130, partial [Bradyrhizobium sp. HKCCYLRH3097]
MLQISPSEMSEGAGKARRRLAPAARLREKMQAAGTTGAAENAGGLKRWSQHQVFSFVTAARQALLLE